uniref:Uncharacterized protein n=1 Tax=Romanomermis culicivorax TaxID=13658 RepID=A0A915IZI3_ROMCU
MSRDTSHCSCTDQICKYRHLQYPTKRFDEAMLPLKYSNFCRLSCRAAVLSIQNINDHSPNRSIRNDQHR